MLSQKYRLKSISGKLVYEMLFYTGLRMGEMEALTWEKIDLRSQQIAVEKTLIYKTKDDWHLPTPKTEHIVQIG
ncbi:tyrosine-type recombinase/integrase [Enterococcus hulanensis]|uniref:tyrosine-type recombinase/integrase n=1 Tax=Enterococcus hulanensis TaxID=2559929 RepID=UPI0028922D56|nr:tyrosine-type recombinase/integrase [Enterococcus hulanensis]MDT2658931.1 tyrosine-type recombinase/integrase [Enterococcus hulanensis]